MSTTKRVKGAEPSENADADHDETFAKRLRKVPPSTSAAVAASTPNKSGKAISNAKKNATTTATSSTKASAGGVVHEIDHAWTYMFYQLMLYRAEHGDFNVPPKATEHKKLCDWIKEQRRQFKLYQETHHPSSTTLLTEEQVLVLESVQFPLTTRGDDHWKRNLENLKKFKEEHGHVLVPRLSEIQGLGDWVTDQRRQLKALKQGKPSLLTPDRKKLLDELGFVWEVRNRQEWGDRYQQLLEYKEKNGTTCVPQFYAENRGLGKWVAKQREQYKLKRQGKHSFLTPDREEQLVQIGFVWSIKGQCADDGDDDDDDGDQDMMNYTAVLAASPAAADVHDANGGTTNRHHAAAADYNHGGNQHHLSTSPPNKVVTPFADGGHATGNDVNHDSVYTHKHNNSNINNESAEYGEDHMASHTTRRI